MRIYKQMIILILVSLLLVNPVISSETSILNDNPTHTEERDFNNTHTRAFLYERYDCIRPAIGGIQIHVPGTEFLGTLGFAAIDEEGTLGYVTSFHVVDNTQNQIYQPSNLCDPFRLGKATDLGDPNVSHSAWVPCDGNFSVCPRVYKERYAVDYEVDSYNDSKQYDTVYLSGVTSGLQYGRVLYGDRKVTVHVDNNTYDMEHQCMAHMTSDPGDSGAPIFKITDGNSIEIVGLQHSSNEALELTYYSHISQVIGDLNVVPCTVSTYGNTPFPGYTMDLDGDGLYEDVTGNGELGFTDLTVFNNNMEWI